MAETEIDYATTGYFADLWGVTSERIRQYCVQGRIPGAKLLQYGSRVIWHIPITATQPHDRRTGRIIVAI